MRPRHYGNSIHQRSPTKDRHIIGSASYVAGVFSLLNRARMRRALRIACATTAGHNNTPANSPRMPMYVRYNMANVLYVSIPFSGWKAELEGQQATPRPIRAIPAMRLITTPMPLMSAPKSRRNTSDGQASRSMPVPASASLAVARVSPALRRRHQWHRCRNEPHRRYRPDRPGCGLLALQLCLPAAERNADV